MDGWCSGRPKNRVIAERGRVLRLEVVTPLFRRTPP